MCVAHGQGLPDPQTGVGKRIFRRLERCDYDVVADGVVVGRIMKVHAAPVGSPWMWTLMFGHHEDRTPTHGYAPTREAAMTTLAKSWRRK
jgi:hypothetical protein